MILEILELFSGEKEIFKWLEFFMTIKMILVVEKRAVKDRELVVKKNCVKFLGWLGN